MWPSSGICFLHYSDWAPAVSERGECFIILIVLLFRLGLDIIIKLHGKDWLISLKNLVSGILD